MNQAYAQVNIGEAFKLKPGQGIADAEHLQSVGGLITAILPNIFVLAGIILLFLLIFGGVAIILGAGKGNEERIQQGKQTITSALIGFLVVFAAYWIIQIVEIVTGIPIF